MFLKRGQGSRHALRAGDVFTLGLIDGRWLFGRVIEVEVDRPRAPMPASNLIYIYDYLAQKPEPRLERLRPDALLAPPLFINRLPWSRGYFETLFNLPLRPEDLLRRHCWERVGLGYYLDRDGHKVTRSEPCGIWGLSSFMTVDGEVSRALGLKP